MLDTFTVNQGVLGSSPSLGATQLNTGFTVVKPLILPIKSHLK